MKEKSTSWWVQYLSGWMVGWFYLVCYYICMYGFFSRVEWSGSCRAGTKQFTGTGKIIWRTFLFVFNYYFLCIYIFVAVYTLDNYAYVHSKKEQISMASLVCLHKMISNFRCIHTTHTNMIGCISFFIFR